MPQSSPREDIPLNEFLDHVEEQYIDVDGTKVSDDGKIVSIVQDNANGVGRLLTERMLDYGYVVHRTTRRATIFHKLSGIGRTATLELEE